MGLETNRDTAPHAAALQYLLQLAKVFDPRKFSYTWIKAIFVLRIKAFQISQVKSVFKLQFSTVFNLKPSSNLKIRKHEKWKIIQINETMDRKEDS